MKLWRSDREGKMDEINWTLYRYSRGLWVAFSSTAEGHNTMDRKNMEWWRAARGLRTEEIGKLFRDAEDNGEAAITLSLPHERRD